MSNMLNPILSLRGTLTLVLVAALALFLQACGGKEEPATEPGGDTPALKGDSGAPAMPPVPEGMPDTYGVLRFMPESAQVALALPPIPGIQDKAVPLLRVLTPDEDIEDELSNAAFELGDGIGVEAESFEELAAALGVDIQAPMAVFFDVSRTVDSALAAQEAAKSEGGDQDAKGSDTESDDPADPGAEAMDAMEDAEEPAWIGVLGLADPAKARAELERIISEDEDLSALPKSTETVEGIELSVRGDYGYFTTRRYMVLGDLELLRGAAGRVSSPASIRYGTETCPATAPDEAVMLVYGNRFLPFLDQALPVLMQDVDDAALPLVQAQLEQYKGMFASGEDEDPVVGTLSWVDDRLEMLWRIDTKANPGVLAVSGDASPLRLARYLPENTLALLSIRFNEVFKNQLMNQILPVAQASGGGDVAMAGQIIPQLGDELTIGITDVVDDSAGLYILLGLAQPEATQGVLQMFVPMQGGMEYKGYTINNVPVPAPVPVYLSFVDDFALAGTSEAGLKAIIDLHADKKVSGLFMAMKPPFDIELPRYQAFNVNTQLLGGALSTTAGSFGADLSEADPVLSRITAVLRELRTSKELSGDWMNGRITLHFNDLDAAAAKLDAMANEAGAEDNSETAPDKP